jgi:hypothetical protein
VDGWPVAAPLTFGEWRWHPIESATGKANMTRER